MDRNRHNFDRRILYTAITSLIVVVAIVFVLHIYARCFLGRQARRRRAIRHLSMRAPAAAQVHSHEPPKTGLDPSVIASIPVLVYRRTEQLDKTNTMECTICLSSIEDGEMTRVLPNCKHVFHVECIDMWLSSHSACPVCRTGAEPQTQAQAPSLQTHEAGIGVLPTAPPLDSSEGTSDGAAQSSKVGGGSFSRLSSFKKMLGRDRSESRVQADEVTDLERQ